MLAVDDQTLAEQGLDARGSDPARVLVLACGALAREILALFEINNWDHMDLRCLPAKWHMTPDLITVGVEDAVAKHRDDYDEIFVAYADCGTGGQLQAKCAELGVEMIAGPHCYSFFEGNEIFSEIAEEEITAFYLTDFLVSVFDSFFWKPMGLDRHPELLEMYFGNYEKVVYQAQTDNAELTAKAEDCAARMGLPLERRFTGYGDLESALAALPAGR